MNESKNLNLGAGNPALCPDCKTWPVDGSKCPRCGNPKPFAQQPLANQEDHGEFCSDTAALAFLRLIGGGNPNIERAVERLRSSLIDLAQQLTARTEFSDEIFDVECASVQEPAAVDGSVPDGWVVTFHYNDPRHSVYTDEASVRGLLHASNVSARPFRYIGAAQTGGSDNDRG